jgi:hypothetical protein
MIEWYVGFHRPTLRGLDGKIAPSLWFGHCHIWGYTEHNTYLFLDPRGKGTGITVTHMHEEVTDHLNARFLTCDTIMRLPATEPNFSFPLFGLMTCASIVGHITGHRALLPSTLGRKLRAAGAEVIHEYQGRSEG